MNIGVEVLKESVIRVQSQLNDWMDCVFVVSKDDEEKAREVLEKAWDSFWEDGDGWCYGNYLEDMVFGTAGRELSEKDGLKVPVCNNCHNMGEILKRIHGNPMAERMSKIIGQLAWEKEYALQKADEFARIIDADREESEVKQIIHKGGRETFRKRYGCSYL